MTVHTSPETVTITTAVPTTSLSPDQFKARMATAITEAGNAFDGLSSAFGTQDFAVVHIACTRLGNSGRAIAAILPSSEAKLTAALQHIVDEIATVEGDCLAMSAASTDADYAKLKAEMSRLHDDLQDPSGSPHPAAASTIKPEGAAQSVVDLVSEKTGFTPTDVTCPDGIEATAGQKFNCTFTGPDGDYTAHMKVLKVEGEQVLFDINTTRN